MHGQYIKDIEYEEAVQHVREGVAKSYGTRKTVVGYQLTVSLERVAGYEYSGRSLVPANFAGTRYIFRLKWATENVNTFLYRFKYQEDSGTDGPVAGLLRILTAPALESGVYTPRAEATEQERAADPGKIRRQNVAALFSAVPIRTYRPDDAATDEPEWQSLWFSHLKSTVPSRPAVQPEWAARLQAQRALEQQSTTLNLN